MRKVSVSQKKQQSNTPPAQQEKEESFPPVWIQASLPDPETAAPAEGLRSALEIAVKCGGGVQSVSMFFPSMEAAERAAGLLVIAGFGNGNDEDTRRKSIADSFDCPEGRPSS